MNSYVYDMTKVEQRRLELAWSKRQLARVSGLTPNTITNVFKGQKGQTRNPETARKLANAVGLTVESLVILEEVA